MSIKKYISAGIATIQTGDFGLYGWINPNFALTDRVRIHRTDVQKCRVPDKEKGPAGTLSQLELIELPEVQTYCGAKTKWVIAHWIINPATREKIGPHPWEAFCCTDRPSAPVSRHIKAYEAIRAEWKKKGFFLSEGQYQFRIRAESRRKIKETPPAKVASCRDADLSSARASVLEKLMPHTVRAIRTGDPKAGEYFEHESSLPGKELEAADCAIVKAYTTSPHPPTAKALAAYVYQQTGKRYSAAAIKKRRERLGLVGGKTGPRTKVPDTV